MVKAIVQIYANQSLDKYCGYLQLLSGLLHFCFLLLVGKQEVEVLDGGCLVLQSYSALCGTGIHTSPNWAEAGDRLGTSWLTAPQVCMTVIQPGTTIQSGQGYGFISVLENFEFDYVLLIPLSFYFPIFLLLIISLSVSRIFFNKSCKGGLVLFNFLSFCLGAFLFLPHF